MNLAALLLLAAATLAAQKIDAVTQIQNPPWVDSRSYQFTRINGTSAPGTAASGDLATPGAGKTVTFTRCPAGLVVGDMVTISGGTGTAETVALTATTCSLAGGAAGSITVTTANAHTGAWRVTSGTDGFMQAQRATTLPGVLLKGYYAPLFIWNNPATVPAGVAAGLYVNISNNRVDSPGLGDLIGASIRVTNDANANHPMWGVNIGVVQGNVPTGHTQIRAAEFEVINKATSLTAQLDPYGGTFGSSSIRSNGIEIFGSAGSTYRNTAAVVVWANSTNADQTWWDTGIALSRVTRHGILFRQNPGGVVGDPGAFAVCAICEESNSATSMRITGSHTNIFDLTSATAASYLFNLGTFQPVYFVKGSGGQFIRFNDVKVLINGPSGSGAGNEILALQDLSAGINFMFRQQSAAGVIEFGTTSAHHVALMAGNAQRMFIDAASGTVQFNAGVRVGTLAAYANNAAALAAGRVAGDFYVVSGSDPRQVAVVF